MYWDKNLGIGVMVGILLFFVTLWLMTGCGQEGENSPDLEPSVNGYGSDVERIEL